MSADRLRAVVIGARCRRQGIGHHLARFLHAEGVEIAAICGTTGGTADEAADALAPILGARPWPYTSVGVGAMLENEHPDIAVIASPDETHGMYLSKCLRSDVHVLCEKPVCWGGANPAWEALAIAQRYLERGLHLVVNAQWPYTLPSYRRLFPSMDLARCERFYMRLSPAGSGEAMLPAGLPHPIALLLSVVPPGRTRIEGVDRAWLDAEQSHFRVRFDLVHDSGRIACEVELRAEPEQPRPAGYGFDGAIAWREIELEGYRMRLRDGDRVVPLPDPTPLLVRSFVERVRGPAPTTLDPSVDPGMSHLVTLAARSESPTA